jgi:hypothetical protein
LRSKFKIKWRAFFLAGCTTLLFSSTQVQQCSDYLSYQQIYDASTNEFSLLNFLRIDTVFYNLSSLWQSFVDYRKYDLFVASYQTISLTILIAAIYVFCGKWRNTILFLNLFGSLQFYHLSLCTLRQGLSSGITVLLLILIFKREELLSANQKIADDQLTEQATLSTDNPLRKKDSQIVNFMNAKRPSNLHSKNTLFVLNTSIIFTTLLSANTHWTGVIMAMIIYAIKYLYKIRLDRKRVLLPVIMAFIVLLPIFSIIGNRIEVYLAELGTGYGEKIALTVISDLVLVLMIFNNMFKNPDVSIKSIAYLSLLLISSLIIFLKVITLFGFGLALRLILGLTTIQLICLPVLLNNLSFLLRLSIIALISIPYVVFIFSNNTEKFISI